MPVHQPTNAFALANPSRSQQGAVSKSVGYLNRTSILVPRTHWLRPMPHSVPVIHATRDGGRTVPVGAGQRQHDTGLKPKTGAPLRWCRGFA